MSKAALLVFLLAAPLLATSAEFEIQPQAGVGMLRRAPYLPVRVVIRRARVDQGFSGRVVAQVNRYSRSGFGGSAESEYSLNVEMKAGLGETVVLLNLPFNDSPINARLTLERAVGGGHFEQVAEAPLNENAMNSAIRVVGFISSARLEAINSLLFDFALLEVPRLEMVADWKALLAYDAIIVNTEQLTREQNDALAEYVAAGGALFISPRTAASFNPGLPAGELLGIPSTSGPREETLAASGFLFDPIKYSGSSAASQLHDNYGYGRQGGRRPMARPPANAPANAPPSNAPDQPEGGEAIPEDPAPSGPIKLHVPGIGEKFTLWANAGRARPADRRTGNLVSVARVGAGVVVFIHADISSPPFTAENDVPSLAGANLIIAAFNAAKARGLGLSPFNALAGQNGRQLVDIAGHRIPGNSSMIVAAFLYIFGAGIGIFFLARKLRRPELYPAGLVVFGVVSVVGVFSLGNWFKRAGERVNAVRVIVSDNVSGRVGTFSLGCAYVPSGGEYVLTHRGHASLVVAALEVPGARGMPNDLVPAQTSTPDSETSTKLSELTQFQNVLFVAHEPSKRETLKFEVSGTEGALNLENPGEFNLRGCIAVVGGPTAGSGGLAQWHYVSSLGSSGGTATLTASTTRLTDIADLRARLESDLGADSLEFRSLMTLFRRVNTYGDSRPVHELETELLNTGLMPAAGEVLIICALPPEAVSAQSLGTPEAPEDVRQACIWCVRCVIP